MIQEDDTFVIHGPAPLQPLPKTTLGRLVYDQLVTNPNDHEALVDALTGSSISYRQLLQKSCSLAESLLHHGYGKDTIISICSENSLQFFIPIMSALYIGAITAPVNHMYTEFELIHALGISKPRVLFCSTEVYKKHPNLKNKLNYLERVVIIDTEVGVFDEAVTMDEFIGRHSLDSEALLKFQLEDFDAAEQTAFIMCSSGTTGLPKGVMQTHTNGMVRYMHTLDERYVMKIDKSSCFFGILPFFHGYGLLTNFFAIVLNQKIVLMKKFDERLFLKSIQKYRISTLWIAPPLMVFLAKSPLVDEYDLSSITELVSGAAPLSKDTEETVKKRLNIRSVRQGYGLTEATLGVTVMTIGDQRFGSSGKVIAYMSCKVRDPETGRSLGPNQVGELCFKGPMVMKGYYNNEEATRQSFTSDGWLLSGDLGYYDDEQYFFIVDRLKELIKYKGFQVAPAELEAILLTNPKIKDAGVVGVPEEMEELPLAFVVKNPGVDLSAKEVEKFVAELVSPHKRLRGGVIFVSEIPKNPSGKILRRELRNMLKSYKAKL